MEPIAIIRLVAPEFETVSDADLSQWISLCEPLVSKRKFGALYNQAVALLAAHRMKLSGKYEPEETSAISAIANAGRVASYTEGQVSISFNSTASAAGTEATYELTSYGQQFLSLRRSIVVPITLRGGCPYV